MSWTILRNIPHPLIATPGPSYRGVMWPPLDQLTKDGYDLQWGTNVVGHFYFTELLMPALLAGVKTSPDKHARVITTSSSGAYLDIIHFDTFKDGPERKKMSTEALYYQTKHVSHSLVATFLHSKLSLLTGNRKRT